jgi:nucleoside-diphosphate-sugar epimerase
MIDDPRFARLRGRRVCVTGGAGFIGSHLVDALHRVGASVAIIDDFSNGRDENIAHHGDRLDVVRGSILEPAALREAFRDAEIIFHHAALTSVPRSVEQPALSHEVNAVGTQRVLEAAREAGVSRVIYAASSSAYGERTEPVKVETMPPHPMSPYAAAKCAGELLLQSYARCYGLSGVSLRYFNIFGPRQRADSPYAAVIPRFIEAFREGRRPTVFGDGSQTRDFTHVANAVHGNLLAAASERVFCGEVVNIACGFSTSLGALVEKIAGLLNVSPAVDTAPFRVGEVLHSRANIGRARDLLGYAVVVPFDEGLRDVVSA